MTDLRKAAQQALETLENCTSEHGHRCNRCDSEVDEGGKVTEALRAALAQPDVQEPVTKTGKAYVDNLIDALLLPIAAMTASDLEELHCRCADMLLMYATPALAQPDVPEGWVLVPVEPTEEMTSAGAQSIIDGRDKRPGASWAKEAQMAYRAMLAAAPKGGA